MATEKNTGLEGWQKAIESFDAPKETRQQRRERINKELVEKGIKELEAFISERAPLRMLQIAAKAHEAGIETIVKTAKGAITLEVNLKHSVERIAIGDPEFEFDSLEQDIELALEEQREKMEKLRIAREAYDLLTKDQRAALGLTHRP